MTPVEYCRECSSVFLDTFKNIFCDLKIAKCTLKILGCSFYKMFKVCLVMYMKRLSEILIFLLSYLVLVMCDFEGSSIYKYDGESSIVGGCVTHRIGKLSVRNPLMYSASL